MTTRKTTTKKLQKHAKKKDDHKKTTTKNVPNDHINDYHINDDHIKYDQIWSNMTKYDPKVAVITTGKNGQLFSPIYYHIFLFIYDLDLPVVQILAIQQQ